jgi:hypothetical protein
MPTRFLSTCGTSKMMHGVLFSIVAAEIVKFGSQIARYRRDA